MAALPAQIVLPSSRDVTRPGQPGPAHAPRGTLVIGRVLAARPGATSVTPDGRAALRVSFPQGIVLVPTEDDIAAGTQLFAQVREQEGQVLLALLDGIGRGTLVRGHAGRAAEAGQHTTIALSGEPAPVETTEAFTAGQDLVAQVQPRGSRAVLRALPRVLAEGAPTRGRVVSIEGPLAVVTVQESELLARVAAPLLPGATVTVRVVPGSAGPEVVAAPAGAAIPAPLASTTSASPATPAVFTSAEFQAAARPVPPGVVGILGQLNLPQSASNRVAVAALLAVGFAAPAPGEGGTPAPATVPTAPTPPPAAPGTAAPAASATAPTVAPQPAPTSQAAAPAPPATDVPPAPSPGAVQPAVRPAPASPGATVSTASPGLPASPSAAGTVPPPAISAAFVSAAAALDAADVPVTVANVNAAATLVSAEIAVTGNSVQAATEFLALNLPVTPPTIAAAVALMEIALPLQARPVQALATTLFTPSTLSTDLAIVRDVAVEAAREPLPPTTQAVFTELARGLTALVLDLQRGVVDPQQLAAFTRFGGLHTEALLGGLSESVESLPPASESAAPGAPAGQEARPAPSPDTAPAVTRAAEDAGRDVRVLLSRLQTALREAGQDAPRFVELRAAVEDAAPRILERIQGLQLQNLRAPVSEQLTLEVPVRADGTMQTVQLTVYYRRDDATGTRRIDARNTTLALLLDTTRLGPVTATMSIVDGTLNTDFRVDTQGIADHLLTGAAELRDSLDALDYRIGPIRATARRPPTPPAPPVREQRLGPDGIDVQV